MHKRLLGILATLVLALALGGQASAAPRPTCGGDLASWSDAPDELASWSDGAHLLSVRPKGNCDAVLARAKKQHKQTRVTRSK
jgi:hypothetical protein